MSEFRIGDEDFLLDGEPFRVLSGALHYFRVHPDQWRDRIRKARQMGLNTIETYVPWNAHAPTPDTFDLSGGLDLGRFLDDVAAEGMRAIVRPGPYICAEWTNGGLPAWLFASETVGVRRDEPQYLAAVDVYLRHLGPVIAPRQIDRGGPVILVQVENEYGAYGSDPAYLEKLTTLTRDIGITVPLTTVDQPEPQMLENGSIPGLHKTASFGSRPIERLATLRAHQPSGPLMCSEFWDGWFDHWGAHHHTTSVAESARDLDELLGAGASVNLYMFHGGTNFAFTNGANDKGVYQPLVTSYDYDAPLDEAGDPTPKYWAFREVLTRYNPVAPDDAPGKASPAPALTARFTHAVALGDVVTSFGAWTAYDHLPTMEELGRYDGFALYRTEIDASGPAALQFAEVRDRALVSLDGRPVGVLARDHHDRTLALPADARGTVEVLLEDQGRVNYGPRIGEAKGLIGPARLNAAPLERWEAMALDLTDISPVRDAATSVDAALPAMSGPVFAVGAFELDEPVHLFLATERWGKGSVWINGFNIGRYWSRGPQQTLYVPGSILRAGRNEIIALELQSGSVEVRFVPRADLGHTEF